MNDYPAPRQVLLAYFSGTGGTKRAAETLAGALIKRGCGVEVRELRGGRNTFDSGGFFDMLIVAFPVYAANAPQAVYDFIAGLPEGENRPAAVFSVSGGGEVTPNTACRSHAIRRLEKRGYRAVYERMLVMPANVFIRISDDLVRLLLEALPEKLERAAEDIQNGVLRRTRPKIPDRLLSALLELEKRGGKGFGQKIKIGEGCTGCGLCANACPGGNIRMEESRPVFQNQCQVCLRCLYQCPQKALSPGVGRILLLKEGYDLPAMEKRLAVRPPAAYDERAVKALTKGWLYSGMRKYLLEK